MGRILGPSKLITTDEFPKYKDKFQFFIIGSPVYCEIIDKRIIKMLTENREFFKDKKTVCYVTSLAGKVGEIYLKTFREILGSSLICDKVIDGRMIIDSLNKDDNKAISDAYKAMGLELKDNDKMDKEQIGKFGLDLKEIRDSLENGLEEKILKGEIDKFLLSHNTLSLTTGSTLGLRCTPIEYSYYKGNIYLLSEGGEKFAHLLLSDEVCISIYDNYTGFDKLSGMQIKGKAEILDKDTEEYLYVVEEKGLTSDKINAFGIDMNIIRVKPEIIEFLSSEFKKYNVSLKQILKLC